MFKFGVLGYGKMGSAFATGVEELFGKENIAVSDRSEYGLKSAKERGYALTGGAGELFAECETILVSVKPQDLSSALTGVDAVGKIVVSIAAGVPIEKLKSFLNGAHIARVMPNTCATIRKCCSTVAFSEGFPTEKKDIVFSVLEALGGYAEVEEKKIDDYLAVSGSFTAYQYYYLKLFAKATKERGCDFATALYLAAKTASGAAEMVLKGEKDIDTLINDVCSKGGTTIAGLNDLENSVFYDSIRSCVDDCAERAKELAKLK